MTQQVMIVARAPLAQRRWIIAGDAKGVGTALANLLEGPRRHSDGAGR